MIQTLSTYNTSVYTVIKTIAHLLHLIRNASNFLINNLKHKFLKLMTNKLINVTTDSETKFLAHSWQIVFPHTLNALLLALLK